MSDDVVQCLDWVGQESGWITGDILCDWAEKCFLPAIKKRRLLLEKNPEDAPALLLMDGHGSRCNSKFLSLLNDHNMKLHTLVAKLESHHAASRLARLHGTSNRPQRTYEQVCASHAEPTRHGCAEACSGGCGLSLSQNSDDAFVREGRHRTFQSQNCV